MAHSNMFKLLLHVFGNVNWANYNILLVSFREKYQRESLTTPFLYHGSTHTGCSWNTTRFTRSMTNKKALITDTNITQHCYQTWADENKQLVISNTSDDKNRTSTGVGERSKLGQEWWEMCQGRGERCRTLNREISLSPSAPLQPYIWSVWGSGGF